MIGKNFIDIIEQKAHRNKSRTILALDVTQDVKTHKDKRILWNRALNIAILASKYLAAIKVGYPLILATGLDIVGELKQRTKLPIIGDFKIADIGNTNKWIARHAYNAGIDALIVHAIIGEDAVRDVIKVAEEYNRAVFLLVSMSHPGAIKFIKPHIKELTELAVSVGATGVIAPATRPEEIKLVREMLSDEMLILSPGIGAQGAKAGIAIRNGADFEIVGRRIYSSDDIELSAKIIAQENWRAYSERRASP
ncbi:MAG: orotidine-5'-phosphate decarboxylase [Candidatus Odinarchaeota archaeon]|nr:orotidine-5'-phosphate decarboxylase [Candidatus Odinarchaeota archaeon]